MHTEKVCTKAPKGLLQRGLQQLQSFGPSSRPSPLHYGNPWDRIGLWGGEECGHACALCVVCPPLGQPLQSCRGVVCVCACARFLSACCLILCLCCGHPQMDTVGRGGGVHDQEDFGRFLYRDITFDARPTTRLGTRIPQPKCSTCTCHPSLPKSNRRAYLWILHTCQACRKAGRCTLQGLATSPTLVGPINVFLCALSFFACVLLFRNAQMSIKSFCP